MVTKRLYRSRKERMVWGVAGGLAEYLDIDPVLVRIAFVLLAFANGLGVLLYIIMAIVVRSEPQPIAEAAPAVQSEAEVGSQPEAQVPPEVVEETQRRRRNVLGFGLVIVGAIVLMSNVGAFHWFRWDLYWPILVIVAGVIILAAGMRDRR